MAPLNLPFIVASVISPANNDTSDPPPLPSEILAPPNPHLTTKSTHPPSLQRLFPSQQIPGTFTLHQNGESFASSSFSSSSSSSMSHEESHHMNSSHFSRSNTEPLLGQSQDSSSNSIISEQEEESSSSSSSQNTPKKPDTTANPLPATRKVISRAKLFPTSVKPTTVLNSVSQGVGKTLLSHQMPVLQRPLTPKTRPLTRLAQRPVSEDYIKNFPEAAAPEGFPGEDPEEETIKNNIIELQRIN
ncbi:uncharacterized protein [Palaemon carinicauda]|uniref:uncharacterized protein n=1 Tax=Palaemon carinicauda TaxID=392227 RepID=UPI0035B651C0